MNENLKAALLEATRLTQAGRLIEAAALIQRALGQGAYVPELFPAETAGAVRAEAAPDEPGDAAIATRVRAQEAMADGAPISPAVPAVGWLAGRHVGQEGALDYRLYVPAPRDGGMAGEAPALILLLHGCGQDADTFATLTRMSRLADALGCLLLFPTQAISANGAGCWNWHLVEHQRRHRGEPAILAELTRRILAEHGVDRRRVYVAGLSAGGAMALIMAATYPDLFAAVGVHSGLPYGAVHDMVSAMTLMRQGAGRPGWDAASPGCVRLPTIVFQGDADSTVHPANAALILAQVIAGQATMSGGRASETRSEEGQVPGGRAYRRVRYLDDEGVTRVELWMILGAGHGWSGGGAAAFSDPDGPDASREMARFFMEHPRSSD